MFTNFFFLELKYSLRQPMVYVFFLLMALFTFGATASDNIMIGDSVGNVFRNSPHTITIYTSIMTLFGLIIATAFYNNAALRDHNNQFNEILFSKPLKKSGYFFGRFLGALVLSTIPMLGVFFGVWIGTILAQAFQWIDADRFGGFYFETFFNNYFLFILPNIFFAGSIIFALANTFRSTVVSFVGSLILIIGYTIAQSLSSDLENETIAALFDPFGIQTYFLYSKYFTPVEKNTLNPAFTGLLLFNRLIWITLGTIILMLTYTTFSFRERNKKSKTDKAIKQKTAQNQLLIPLFKVSFTKKTELVQFRSFFHYDLIGITKNISFRILFLFAAILLIADLASGFEYYGLQSYPLTYKIINAIDGQSSLFTMIILVFFSGELVWRDRESKINEVIDASPHTSVISLTSKCMSLLAVVTLLHVFFVICGIIYQLINGYTRIEPTLYLSDFFLTYFFYYLIWGGVMIMVQVLLNNKYIGYFVSITIIFVWSLLLNILDVQSNMLSIGSRPSLSYSDMNGFGPGLYGALWFHLYWTLFTIICLLIAGMLWGRGSLTSLKERIWNANKTIPKSYKAFILCILGLWFMVGGFVFYNTQILNTYRTSDEMEEWSATYEKKYKKYQDAVHPKISDAKYYIDIFPYKRDVHVKALLEFTNDSGVPVDSIHFTTDPKWNTKINIPNTELVYEDNDLDYYIYKCAPSIMPGQRLTATLSTKYISKGFENNRGNTKIVKNGTFINNIEILPTMGYDDNRELSDKNTRKKYGLKPKDRMPPLEDDCYRACMKNYISNGKSDFINIETVISTASDQTAIAPGSLLNEWKENDRNYYHYRADHPSQNFYSFLSAKYQIAEREWNGIKIEVYHDEKHHWNVGMMLDAVQRSLDYYTQNFGEYHHKQCRIIEFPRYGSFAQAFPGTMPYSESFGFIINLEDENENNIIDAVISHEMAHQWWAHQVVGANMQGATMLSESFAEYASLMTMKKTTKTPMKMREFIKYDHNRYLKGRGRELDKELPLYKVENQSYIHYGKGSIVMFALQDYLGEDIINTALKQFLEGFKYKAPPYPTSLDFMKYLEATAPDSMRYLIKDWVKEITLYDNRLNKAVVEKLENGKYLATVDIETYKLKADTIGIETKVPIDDWIDIGFFTDLEEERLLFEKRVKVRENIMTFTFELDSMPVKAAIDPRKLLIDRIYSDNIKKIKEVD